PELGWRGGARRLGRAYRRGFGSRRGGGGRGGGTRVNGRDGQQLAAVARLMGLVPLPGEYRTQAGRDLRVVVEAQHGVRLGQALGELAPVPLGQDGGRDHLRTTVRRRAARVEPV